MHSVLVGCGVWRGSLWFDEYVPDLCQCLNLRVRFCDIHTLEVVALWRSLSYLS